MTSFGGADDSVITALLAGLSVLVVGLLGIVLMLLRSLKKTDKTSRAAAAAARERPPPSRPTVAREAPPPPPPSHPNRVPVHAGDDDEDDQVTRLTPFAAPAMLPRLGAEQEEDDDAAEMSISESKAILQFESEAWVDIDEPTGPHELILISAVGQTDRGLKRRRNEDAYLIDTELQLYAVADGMGGYAGGDIASKLAVHEVRTALKAPGKLTGYEDRPRRGRELIAGVERANRAIFDEAQKSRDLKGMGTTMIAARFSPQKQRMYLAHVGDSRCYRFRGGELQMLTKDHTLASRGVIGPMAGNICRAVGVGPTVKVDLVIDKPLPEDVYLLCSDGLPKMLDNERIRALLVQHHASSALDDVAEALVAAANTSGGRDNVTVVLVGVHEITKSTSNARGVTVEKRVEFGPS